VHDDGLVVPHRVDRGRERRRRVHDEKIAGLQEIPDGGERRVFDAVAPSYQKTHLVARQPTRFGWLRRRSFFDDVRREIPFCNCLHEAASATTASSEAR
jgi:hypothetical protein